MARTLQENKEYNGHEIVVERQDGSRSVLLAHANPFNDESGRLTGAVNVLVDITERRKLEEQLRQSQKMEAVGRLAGGIAHDFNNLLTVIGGYVEIILSSLPPDDPHRVSLGQVRDAGERAGSLTRQLLAFSRKQILRPKVLDLNNVVYGSEKMLRRLIGEDISVTCTLNSLADHVKVDPSQLEQVILNLAINARDAMPQGGRLMIETRQVVLTDADCRADPELRPGRFVVLSVGDTGCGMTPEVLGRVFEPFYTTKDQGKGTGLGLAMVYGVVKQSGGLITVSSQVGAGTTFRIYFPAVPPPKREEAGGVLTAPSPACGTETVLLVEDEPAVRAMALLALSGYGYKVLEARNGADALRVAGQYAGPIDLLLTDVVMPEMSGRQAAEHLTSARPTLKVLFMSGYTDDAVVRHGVSERETAFIQKPFFPQSLAMKVRDVLDEAGVPAQVPTLSAGTP